MRTDKMLLRAFGVERAVVQGAHWERYRGRQTLVLHVRPYRCEERRCSKCGRRSPRYDRGSGPRRWRCLDVGLCAAYLQAKAPRDEQTVRQFFEMLGPERSARIQLVSADGASWIR